MSANPVEDWASAAQPEFLSSQRRLLLVALAAVLVLAIFFAVRVELHDSVDAPLTAALNAFAHRWPLFDRAVSGAMLMHSFKGFAAFACVFWAMAGLRTFRARAVLVAGCAAAALGALASRGSQFLLPDLPRPRADPALRFVTPIGLDEPLLNGGSSYPSDTMVLLFGVATAVWLVDRRAGGVALVIAALGAFTRVYCGRHFPSDIVGGSALGAAVVLIAAALTAYWTPSEATLRAMARHRALLAAVGFMAAAQAATLFEEPRDVASAILAVIRTY